MQGFHLHERLAAPDCPPGLTVSKHAKLPSGDFSITEYDCGGITLWFVDEDRFTADERRDAFLTVLELAVRAGRE